MGSLLSLCRHRARESDIITLAAQNWRRFTQAIQQVIFNKQVWSALGARLRPGLRLEFDIQVGDRE